MKHSTRLVKIATRSSELALWQSKWVGDRLTNVHKGLSYELVKVGNLPVNHKDSFVKLCEECLAHGTADLAVHSAKDLPMKTPAAMEIAAYCRRENPLDVILFAPQFNREQKKVKIGTASPRRRVQLMDERQDDQDYQYSVQELRGNITTRVEMLGNPTEDANKFDAIVLAAAGLIRLRRTSLISRYLTPAEMVPAAGQGALALQCLRSREDIKQLTLPLKHKHTELCLAAERNCCQILEADCDSAVGAYAFFIDDVMHIYAMAGDIASNKILRVFKTLQIPSWDYAVATPHAELCGKLAADELIAKGALDFIYKSPPQPQKPNKATETIQAPDII